MFFTINRNGVKSLVDADSKTHALQYANRTSEVTVALSSKEDLVSADLASVPSVLKGGKTQAEVDADAAKKAAKGAKAEAAPL